MKRQEEETQRVMELEMEKGRPRGKKRTTMGAEMETKKETGAGKRMNGRHKDFEKKVAEEEKQQEEKVEKEWEGSRDHGKSSWPMFTRWKKRGYRPPLAPTDNGYVNRIR